MGNEVRQETSRGRTEKMDIRPVRQKGTHCFLHRTGQHDMPAQVRVRVRVRQRLDQFEIKSFIGAAPAGTTAPQAIPLGARSAARAPKCSDLEPFAKTSTCPRLIECMAKNPITVSLVLGSGGARGLAHIGVIQWLIENGYDIRSISGSSMGALVGGIFATSKLEVYAEWVLALERMHVLRLLDPTFGSPGLFKGERIIGVLRQLIGDCAIEDLPISFTAVSTDLDSGEEVWLREGNLFDAIRASMATPLVFTPFKHGDRLLVDGAVVNPVPIAPTLDDVTDLTVAVNLSGPGESRPTPPHSESLISDNGYRKRIMKFISTGRPARGTKEPSRGMINVAMASMQTMQDTIARLRMSTYSPDVLIEIPRNACGFFEFWKAEELIALGRERASLAFARRADTGVGERRA
jgi:NTE family protein